MTKPIDQIGLNELFPTLKALAKAGGTTEHADWIRSRSNAAQLIQFVNEQVNGSLVHGLFNEAVHQVDRVRAMNRGLEWGIPDKAFIKAKNSIPAWPNEKLVAVVLVPYLADLHLTFHELWICAENEQKDAGWRWDGYNKIGPDRLRLLKGIKHKVGLRWEVIDLGCNRNKKPEDVRNANTSPHAGILAAAALHPNWVKSMDGDEVPYVYLPGYEVRRHSRELWAQVPVLDLGHAVREIKLGCDHIGGCDSGWAVPAFFGG